MEIFYMSIIKLEICRDCEAHVYCTNHDEKKYLDYQAKTERILRSLPVQCCLMDNPRLGAFEVTLYSSRGSFRVYSKLSTGQWPNINYIYRQVAHLLTSEEWKIPLKLRTLPNRLGLQINSFYPFKVLAVMQKSFAQQACIQTGDILIGESGSPPCQNISQLRSLLKQRPLTLIFSRFAAALHPPISQTITPSTISAPSSSKRISTPAKRPATTPTRPRLLINAASNS